MKCWILSGTCSNHCVRYRFLNFRLLLTYHWAEKEVKEECAFNYPRLSFNLIYYRTLRSPFQVLFFSLQEVFFAVNFGLNVVSSQHATRWFFGVALRNKMSVKNHLFFRFCCPVVTLCSKCPIFVQKFKFIKIFELSRVKLVLYLFWSKIQILP